MKVRFRNFLLSLPERGVRSLTAIAGGLVRELGELSIPQTIRRSQLYRNLVEATLRFLIEQVGQVKGVYPGEEELSEDFLVRRAAGNGIELIGILAFRASPVWVLAALADASGAGRFLVREITASLKADGLLEPGTEFDTVDGMPCVATWPEFLRGSFPARRACAICGRKFNTKLGGKTEPYFRFLR